MGGSILIWLIIQPAPAAVLDVWAQRYNNIVSNALDEPLQIALDPAGNVTVTGTTQEGFAAADFLTIKYSSVDGSVLWQQRRRGPANSDDAAKALVVDTGVIVTGTSLGRGSSLDYYTTAYAAADGTVLWENATTVPTPASTGLPQRPE